MAADEAAEQLAKEKAEKARRYDEELYAYIHMTRPTRSEFIEPLDDAYSSSYSDEESYDYTPPTEDDDDEKPVDYRYYGSRRTFADV